MDKQQNRSLKIILIGSGNVSWHVSQALKAKGNTILQVYSRNLDKAQQLAGKLGCGATNTVSGISPEADIYLFAISDSAIETFSNQPVFKNKTLVHTSGSIPSTIFADVTNDYGVFYPLQTFTTNRAIEFESIPICITASNASLLDLLMRMGSTVSQKLVPLDDEKRKTLHLAAVFANNFVNHLLLIASDLMMEQELDPGLLQPLLEETLAKAIAISALNAQTGPAIRNDTVVMQKHLKILESYPEYEKIYTFVSESINARHAKKS